MIYTCGTRKVVANQQRNTDERLPKKLNPRLTEAMAKATSADVSLDDAGLKA